MKVLYRRWTLYNYTGRPMGAIVGREWSAMMIMSIIGRPEVKAPSRPWFLVGSPLGLLSLSFVLSAFKPCHPSKQGQALLEYPCLVILGAESIIRVRQGVAIIVCFSKSNWLICWLKLIQMSKWGKSFSISLSGDSRCRKCNESEAGIAIKTTSVVPTSPTSLLYQKNQWWWWWWCQY